MLHDPGFLPTAGIFIGVCVVASVIIFLRFKNDNRYIMENGKIEIKFSDEEVDEETNTLKHKDLILEIKYRIVKGARCNKEESAILINELVQNKCRQKGFKIRNNSKKTLKEIKDIIERIKALFPRETDSELIGIEYRISERTIPRWSKDVFLKT